MLWLGILLALLGSFSPGIVLLSMFVALALFVTNAALGEGASAGRSVVVAGGGLASAFVLCFPWSITFVDPGVRWSVLAGAATSPSANPSLSQLLRLATGPLGSGLLGWALLAAAAVRRLRRARRPLCLGGALLGDGARAVGLAWVASQGWLGAGGGAIETILAPFACCLAVLVGLGVATVFSELASAHFGWRHVAGVCFTLFFLAGLLPVLGASARRALLPARRRAMTPCCPLPHRPVGRTRRRRGSCGSVTRALPLTSWQIAPGLAYGVSGDGLPDMTRSSRARTRVRRGSSRRR